ncbi:SET domain-containing protein-lysine N-methyltransferase [uncultured Nostoc sp.]|uniref:SET domain-containing protein-lysine N-methyltransferase n=1 Tax=uncultured Nostoc sp. TaxID=340711 RepID=UPI0035C9BDB6
MMQTTTDEYSFILKPSSIHGVGVFATHPIRSGTDLRLFARSENTRVIPSGSKYDNLFYGYYGVKRERGFACPEDFGRMSVGWYLNHADTPNAAYRHYVFYALCDIDEGEEITINYRML